MGFRIPNIEHLYRMKYGGPSDTLSGLAMGGSALLSSPLFSGVPPITPFALGAGGASWLAWRAMEKWRDMPVLDTTNRAFRSSMPPIDVPRGRNVKDAVFIGYTTDKGRPIWLPYEDYMRHLLMVGQTGVGKTVFGASLMHQQIMNGGGLFFIDGKLDRDNLDMVRRFCIQAGREQDLLVMNPGDPSLSNTYNPILYGDPDEVSSRVLSLIPSTENNPGADYYKQAANQGISTMIAAMQEANLAYNFIDLTILLMSRQAIEHLERVLLNNPKTAGSEASINLSIFMDQFKGLQNPKETGYKASQIDIKKLKETFGGIGGRCYMFGTGKFGRVMNTYTPEIKMYESMRENKIVYCALPTMAKDIAAANFGKIAVGDMRTSIAWLQALPVHKRPWPPFLGLFDEAGAYINKSWDRMFEQSRSAQIVLAPAVQTLANFEAISEELKEMVIGNCWSKMFFKVGTQATALEAAELIGKYMGVVKSMSSTTSQSVSSPNIQMTPEAGLGTSGGDAFQERQQEMYRITPDVLKGLDKGECYMTYGGKQLYNLRIPKIDMTEGFIKEVDARIKGEEDEHLKINRFRHHNAPRGINLFQQAHKYLTGSLMQELENRGKEG